MAYSISEKETLALGLSLSPNIWGELSVNSSKVKHKVPSPVNPD